MTDVTPNGDESLQQQIDGLIETINGLVGQVAALRDLATALIATHQNPEALLESFEAHCERATANSLATQVEDATLDARHESQLLFGAALIQAVKRRANARTPQSSNQSQPQPARRNHKIRIPGLPLGGDQGDESVS